MTRGDDTNDKFTPKLSRIRTTGSIRHQSFINCVLKEISTAGKSGLGTAKASGSFTGYRIGRGYNVFGTYGVGRHLGPTYRRVIIKTRIIKLAGMGFDAARSHLRYIQRDGIARVGEKGAGQLYDRWDDDVDRKDFLDRCKRDRHQFRIIVSPEDATELAGLKPFIRNLMDRIERDLDTRLEWVAVDHFNTGHPHTHIVLRGKDALREDLIIARDYVTHGMRLRASELVSRELGPQTEHELREKYRRQVDQDRYTDLDRELVRDAQDDSIATNLKPSSLEDRFKHTMRMSRLRHLERKGLARETEPGQWELSDRLEATLRRAGERNDIIKTMHRGLKQAGLDVGASDYAIYDPQDVHASVITGQIIDRGLHDELNDGHYIIVDAADGRVHHIALSPKQDMDDLPIGSIVEIHPVSNKLKPSDRVISEIASRNAGLYSPDIHADYDVSASPEFIQAHVRRLEALRQIKLVRRFEDGSWEIPNDFEERLVRHARSNVNYPDRVDVLSIFSLENQIKADGATWLDRQLLAKEPASLREARFTAATTDALRQRVDHLVEQGLVERIGKNVSYQPNLLRTLRQRDISVAGERLSRETNLSFVEVRDGETIKGVYRRPVHLASGKFAIIEKSKEFTLVPWRPVLERQRGKMISGIMRGSSMTFDFTKKRGIGIG